MGLIDEIAGAFGIRDKEEIRRVLEKCGSFSFGTLSGIELKEKIDDKEFLSATFKKYIRRKAAFVCTHPMWEVFFKTWKFQKDDEFKTMDVEKFYQKIDSKIAEAKKKKDDDLRTLFEAIKIGNRSLEKMLMDLRAKETLTILLLPPEWSETPEFCEYLLRLTGYQENFIVLTNDAGMLSDNEKELLKKFFAALEIKRAYVFGAYIGSCLQYTVDSLKEITDMRFIPMASVIHYSHFKPYKDGARIIPQAMDEKAYTAIAMEYYNRQYPTKR